MERHSPGVLESRGLLAGTQEAGETLFSQIFARRVAAGGPTPEQFLTPSRLVATDASNRLTSVSTLTSWVAGTANQVTVANDGDGTITLSLPQNIHTGATPLFAGINIGPGATEGLGVTVVGSVVSVLEQGVGPGRTLVVGTNNSRNTEVWYGGGPIWVFGNALGAGGHFYPYADNTYDIGLASFRPRNIRWGTQALSSSGTAAAPGVSFASGTGHGMYYYGASHLGFSVGGTLQALIRSDGVVIVPGTGAIGFAATVADTAFDTYWTRGAAGVMELKDGTTAQELRVYGTTTGPAYLRLSHNGAGDAIVGTSDNSSLNFIVNATTRWYILSPSGHILPNGGNTYDLGDSTNTVRTVWAGTSFRGPVGSASVVTYGLGAVNTGIFSPGSDYTSIARLGTELVRVDASGLNLHSAFFIGFGSSGVATPDVLLYRDAAATLALRNSTTAQAQRWYKTYTDAANYQRIEVDTANNRIITNWAGTGTAFNLGLGAGAVYWSVSGTTGGFFPASGNSYDIGDGTNTVRDIHVGRQILGADGSSAAPTYSSSSLGTKGMWFPGPNIVELAVATVGVIRIDGSTGIELRSDFPVFFKNATGGTTYTSLTTSAAVLSVVNGTTAQEFRVYGTTTGPVYARLAHDGAQVILGSNTSIPVNFYMNATARWGVNTDANFVPVEGDNSRDLGTSALRVRSGYFGTSISVGTNPASGGTYRGPTGGSIQFRNAANSGDINAVTVTGDVVYFSTGTHAVRIADNSGASIGFFGTTPVAAKTGWGAATGTATRTTFDTATVTLEQLAQRVKAMIDDLHQTAGYGLLRT